MDFDAKFRYICIMTGKCKCRLLKKQKGLFRKKEGEIKVFWVKNHEKKENCNLYEFFSCLLCKSMVESL